MICADLLFIFSSYLQQCYSTNTCKHQIPWEMGQDSDQATFPVHKILKNVIWENVVVASYLTQRSSSQDRGIALIPPHISKRCALAGENVVNNHRNFHFKTQRRFDKTRESSEMGNVNNRNCNAHLFSCLTCQLPAFQYILHTFWRHATQKKSIHNIRRKWLEF